MRVGELDMTNNSTQCPSGLRQRNDSNIRTCTKNSNSGGCSSVTLITSNIHYSRVCGKIKAYQFGNILVQVLMILIVTMWTVLVSLMEGKDNISGHLLQPKMKLYLIHIPSVLVPT